MKQKICDLSAISELTCKEFEVETQSGIKEAFLIYFRQHFYAYENRCPHTGVKLNWQAGQFLSLDDGFIQCSMHGALFNPVTGECVRGPCVGQYLKAVQITMKNNAVHVVG